MFLLRCAFWLSVVYASMYFGSPFRHLVGGTPSAAQPRGAAAFVEPSQGAASSLVGQLVGQATAQATVGMAALCAGRELDCVRDAAKLTALVETAIAGAPEYVAVATAPQRPAPMPVPDPRRHGLLTR